MILLDFIALVNTVEFSHLIGQCRKVTGTLVTLKRLASVQEQRIHPGAPIDVSLSPTPSEIARLPSGSDTGKAGLNTWQKLTPSKKGFFM